VGPVSRGLLQRPPACTCPWLDSRPVAQPCDSAPLRRARASAARSLPRRAVACSWSVAAGRPSRRQCVQQAAAACARARGSRQLQSARCVAPAAERAMCAESRAALTRAPPGAGRPEPEHLRGARVQHAGPLLAGRVCGQWVDRPGARPACAASGAPAPSWAGRMQAMGESRLWRAPAARASRARVWESRRSLAGRGACSVSVLAARGSSLAHVLPAAQDELLLGAAHGRRASQLWSARGGGKELAGRPC